MVSQPYQPRLAEGLIRCYFVHDEVVGFCHQWPRGLLEQLPAEDRPAPGPPPRGPMEDPDAPAYQRLRTRAESAWLPQLKEVLGLDTLALPVI